MLFDERMQRTIGETDLVAIGATVPAHGILMATSARHRLTNDFELVAIAPSAVFHVPRSQQPLLHGSNCITMELGWT
jgi:hypothetical protein